MSVLLPEAVVKLVMDVFDMEKLEVSHCMLYEYYCIVHYLSVSHCVLLYTVLIHIKLSYYIVPHRFNTITFVE